MKKEQNKTVIGLFSLGAIILFITGIILLGGGKFLATDIDYVLYFDGSVSGLNVGAPVVFRGVPLGRVKQISLVTKKDEDFAAIPVYISIDENNIIRASGQKTTDTFRIAFVRDLINKGLRARLQMQSLITGQYRIELDFFPETEAVFRSADHDSEIPTLPSPIDTLQKTIFQLPLNKIANSLQNILSDIEDLLKHKDIGKGISSFANTFTEIENILKTSNIKQATNDLSYIISTDLSPALANFRKSMENMKLITDKIKDMTNSLDKKFEQGEPILQELKKLLKESIATVRSLKELTNTLERNPEALLKGKRGNR